MYSTLIRNIKDTRQSHTTRIEFLVHRCPQKGALKVFYSLVNKSIYSCKENLSKNNKILKSQIEQHLTTLLDYHKKNNIEMPQEYIDLFAKHLDAGSP